MLCIQHLGDYPGQARFELTRGSERAPAVTLQDPTLRPVAGYDGLTLAEGLRWYLEDYPQELYAPTEPKAEAVRRELREWGRESFRALFSLETYKWFEQEGAGLRLRIVSSDPAVLAWPWEALCDPQSGHYLAPKCTLERRIEQRAASWSVGKRPEKLRMLLVIARPKENDVNYFAVTRAVVDEMREEGYPVELDLLRPPTFARLAEVLEAAQRAGRPYHILHFDGHGGYGESRPRPGALRGAEGKLFFETEPRPGAPVRPEPIGAETLGQTLYRCGVSMVVLNACQSAMLDREAESAYASVAASLLHAGIPSVTAMGYTLYVTGARDFVQPFYHALFQGGAPDEAVRAGRAGMFQNAGKRIPKGFQDWLVPQLYQSIGEGERVLPKPRGKGAAAHWASEEEEKALALDRYGFLGRGDAVLELERLLLRPQAGILIHGMAGAGKTTLVKGFLRWLRDTGGLRGEDGALCPVVWFDFRDLHSASAVYAGLARLLPGGAPAAEEERRRQVHALLRERRCFVVWDNLESVHSGMGEEERRALAALLEEVKGGRSRLLLTSRDREDDWLSGSVCARLASDLPGLSGEALVDYCRTIAAEENVPLDLEDRALRLLLFRLGGNPLAVRAVLSRLDERTAEQLLAELEQSFAGRAGDEATERILAAFRLVCDGAPPAEEPVLELLGLFEHNADEAILIAMLCVDRQLPVDSPEAREIRAAVRACLARLARAGFCAAAGDWLWRLHPALRSCLAQSRPASEALCRCFVESMVEIESHFHNDEQARRSFCGIYGASLSRALALAERLEMGEAVLSLLLALAAAAYDQADLARDEALLRRLAEEAEARGNRECQNKAYSILSALASNRGDREAERYWSERLGALYAGEEPDADGYYAMGTVAYRRGKLAEARSCLERALALWEQTRDPRAVMLYGAVGNIAQKQGDRAGARELYRMALEAAQKQQNLPVQALNNQSLAVLAVEEGDLPEAERRYRAALDIFVSLEDTQLEADTHRMLGELYVTAREPQAARDSFAEALRLYETMDQRAVARDVAQCYEGMGNALFLDGKFPEARDWWQEALRRYDGLGMEKEAARVQEILDILNGQ